MSDLESISPEGPWITEEEAKAIIKQTKEYKRLY